MPIDSDDTRAVAADRADRARDMRAVAEWVGGIVGFQRIVSAGAEIHAEEIVEKAVVVRVASIGPIGIGKQVGGVDAPVFVEVTDELGVGTAGESPDGQRVRSGRCSGSVVEVIERDQSIAVDIDQLVAIIIKIFGRQLSLVEPHVEIQIWMRRIDPSIDDADHGRQATNGNVPSIFGIDEFESGHQSRDELRIVGECLLAGNQLIETE
ncbi:hypothetical protein NB063_24060 [Rhodopirellula sp. ICT_H3.1]|uniref:Uncharacterized protein n=1 Tax=Aporhodopirellula aestuarii TaxID=2950107 RepID=A0ABT0UAA7_9BACT|nr:hypothetical protein [Aporhodopirellula aestuarii]MCM2373701.1 hypothetical protein [Aporhodopirellula aestuarii]